MSSASTSALKLDFKSKPVPRRPLTASEIARNITHFETWSTHQRCEQVSYADIADDAKTDVMQVFNVKGRIPKFWIDKSSKEFLSFSQFSTPELRRFLVDSHKSSPSLFSDTINRNDIPELLAEVSLVFSAWRCLQRMRKSKEKWSEADFVSNVYNMFRSAALRESTQRVHCTMSLPQPSLDFSLNPQALRILNPKTVIPDCAIFLPAANIRTLSHSAKSPFKIIKSQASVVKTGSPSRGSSFRYQSTPRAQLPDTPGFEFVSAIWEDKKPVHQMLEDAYRQNRMATASAVRHLHSLRIKVPVFGLIWSDGTVRAHIDWCKREEGKSLTILSAPYPGDRGDDGTFHEWQLDRPCDILSVFFLIKNIDRWTMGPFRDRVMSGITNLLEDVVDKKQKYEPWKRIGDLMPPLVRKPHKENANVSISIATDQSSPPPRKHKGRRMRRS